MAKVQVNIRAKETVYYDQIIEMEEEEFLLLQQCLDADYTATNELFEPLIDRRQVMDSDGLEDGELYLETETGK